MKNIIYIKYGELSLKGKNKMRFVNCLFDNVKRVLSEIKTLKINKQFDHMIISGFTTKNKDKIIHFLKLIPGIGLIIPAFISSKDFSKLSNDVIDRLLKTNITQTTFKVIARRSDKVYPLNSMEIAVRMGGVILRAFKKYSVDVHRPKTEIFIEIKDKSSIFYFNKIKGFGGFPLGINGKALMLISGGIDSPVAAKLLMKKGLHVDFLTFISPPHTDEKALDKVRTLKKILTINNRLENGKLFIVNFTKIQHEISHISKHSYQITIMRRYFMRIAKALASKYGYNAIATGESLGQVASQTIESMQTIQNATNDLLILRPLLTYDKSEIIELAKQFETYETSILPFADSCSLFVPTDPATKPTIHTAISLEEELELISDICNKTLDKGIIIE